MIINPGLAMMADGGGNDNSYVDPSGNVVAFDPVMAAALAQPFANDKAAAKAAADKAAADKAAADKAAADAAAAKKAAADALAAKTGIKLSTNLSDFTPTVQNVFIANAKANNMTPEEYLISRGGASPISGVYGDAVAADPTGYPTDAAYSAALASGGLAAVKDVWNAARAASPVLQAAGIAPKLDAQGQPILPTGPATGSVVNATGPAVTGSAVTGPAITGPAATGPAILGTTGPGLLDATRQNIFDVAKAMMTGWGLYKAGDPTSDALVKTIQDLATQGAGPDTISLALQQSDAYKQRFIGNTTRQQNGMSVLTPADYIQWENDISRVLDAAGVPKGFYAGTNELATLIGNNVNYQVVQNRVDLAAKSIANTDPFYAQQLKNLYGLSQGDMIAHVLDPSIAMPLIQKQVGSASIAAAAAAQGMGLNATTAENLYGQGITESQAQQGFANVALNQTPMQKLAAMWGGDAAVQGQNLVASTFGTAGSAYAEQQIKALTTRETSAFGGSAGAAKGSLGITDTSGLS